MSSKGPACTRSSQPKFTHGDGGAHWQFMVAGRGRDGFLQGYSFYVTIDTPEEGHTPKHIQEGLSGLNGLNKRII